MLVGMTAWAQDWTAPTENEYETSTPVYVQVNVNGMEQLKIEVAAFIDEECRAVSVGAETLIGDNQYHRLRVWGDPTADLNKPITFKVAWGGVVVAFNKTIPFTGETYSEIPVVLNVDMPTGISITNPLNLEQKLSFTHDLTNDVEFTYRDASGADTYIPLGESTIETPLTYEWDFANSSSYFTVENMILSAIAVTDGAYLGLNIPELGITSFTYVNISEPTVPVTSITCTPAEWTVNKGDYLPRTPGLYDAITVLPADASNKSYHFEAADTEAAAVYSNGVFSAGGTYNINIVSEADPSIYTTIRVTVTVPVDGISLNTPSSRFYAIPGENVFELIRPSVSVSPDDATNKEFQFIVPDAASDAIVDGEAVRNGIYLINIASVENPQIQTEVEVVINEIEAPEVVEMEVGDNYKTLLDGQIAVLPESPNAPFTYTLAISDGGAFKDDGTAMTAGDYVLTVTCVENPKAKAEIVVRVATPVKLDFPSTIVLSKLKDTEIELTLVEGSDGFDPSQLEVVVSGGGDFMIPGKDPIEYEPVAGSDNLKWMARANSIGYYDMVVLYKGEYMSNEEGMDMVQVLVPVEIAFNNDGWDWIYIPTGMSLQNEDGNYHSWMNQDANNRIIEIRSQTDLLYNDPALGIFGTINRLSPGDGMYKVKASYENAEDAVFVGDVMEIWWDRNPWKEIVKGYNWIGYPNEWDMTVADLNIVENTVSDGDQIIGKTGFAEYDAASGEWVANGDFYFQTGKGYLYYSTSETVNENGFSFDFIPTAEQQQLQQSVALAAQEAAAESVWQYDAGQFADNMAIVAEIPQLDFPADYTVGAFVGDECRGKGSAVLGGKMMISVAGKAGERVTFRLHNELTGEFIDLNETLTYAQRAGSLKNPVVLTSDAIVTGIAEVEASDDAAVQGIFDLSGRRVENMNAGGIYIVKTLENGKVVARKVIK